MIKSNFSIVGLIFLLSLSLTVSHAQMTPSDLQVYIASLVDNFENDFATYDREVLAKANPDECFYGIGDERNNYVATGVACDECGTDGQAKVNQAYVWGLTKSDDDIWFGTGPNVHCLVIGGFLGATGPQETESYVCEFGDSKFDSFGSILGDFRPPRIYRYALDTKTQTDITPQDPLIYSTLGIRSAGNHNGVAFFAGPGVSMSGSTVNMFAYNTETGAYLGSQSFSEYVNIRKWLVHEDVLYTAVGSNPGGRVLKWTGTVNAPFQFEEVGELDGQGAELAVHEGRIFVTTWPGGIGDMSASGTVVASLYMSPEIPAGGLTSANLAGWTRQWDARDYEVDPVTAATYGGGALASYKGELYWGTMHVPFLSTVAHFSVYGVPSTPDSLLAAVLGTYRAISIFKGSGFTSGSPDIDLLYGSPVMPAYHPVDGWILAPNANSEFPEFGLPGFGNPFNNYTWTMDVYDDQLFVGTMDFSYLLFGELDLSLPMMLPFNCEEMGLTSDECEMLEKGYMTFKKIFDPANFVGADLMRFSDSNTPAVPESLAGVGNNSSYGIRTMVADEDGLFLGMANPMNLLTCTTDKAINNGNGGWSLICLTNSAHIVAPIPTIGEWGIIILGLCIMISFVVFYSTSHIKSKGRIV